MTVGVNPPKTPVTKGSNGIALATIPNICKMPGPPAPFVPTPLPNIGKSGMSPKGYSKKVKIKGKNVAIRDASFKSMGDIASKATGGGIVSMNTEGLTRFIMPGSMNVKFEGKNVQLLGDMMLNNCGQSGSPPNAATMGGVLQPSQPPIPKWDVDCVLAILCREDKDVVKTLSTLDVKQTDTIIFDDPYYDGQKWTTTRFYAAGTAGGNTINIHRDTSCEEAAVTIYHEVLHTQQDPNVLDTFEKREYDAYYRTERWTIDRGLPSQGDGLRVEVGPQCVDPETALLNELMGIPTGETHWEASWDGAVEYVHENYPVPPKSTGPPPAYPTDKTPDGKTILSDGSVRPPRKGDTFPASQPTNNPREKDIPPDSWKCP